MSRKKKIISIFLILLVTGSSVLTYVMFEEGFLRGALSYVQILLFPRLSFTNPIAIYSVPEDDTKILVMERRGIIYQITNSYLSDTKEEFLNLISNVYEFGFELGMLGFAFHPEYPRENRIFVFFTELDTNPIQSNITESCDPCTNSVLASYHVNIETKTVDYTSQELLITLPQKSAFHKAGNIHFGPDNYLYVHIGDDTRESGDTSQNLTNFYGKILRIDVNSKSPGYNYSIPLDNPFIDNSNSFKEEIYAYGLRNPWRGSFDPETGIFWVGDVGGSSYEEINIIRKGGNYGWKIWEGLVCHKKEICQNNSLALEDPFIAYSHNRSSNSNQPYGIAVIAGNIYRGKELLELRENYILTDYLGSIWSVAFNQDNFTIETINFVTRLPMLIHSVTRDANNELIFVGNEPFNNFGLIFTIKKTSTIIVWFGIPIVLILLFVLISLKILKIGRKNKNQGRLEKYIY